LLLVDQGRDEVRKFEARIRLGHPHDWLTSPANFEEMYSAVTSNPCQRLARPIMDDLAALLDASLATISGRCELAKQSAMPVPAGPRSRAATSSLTSAILNDQTVENPQPTRSGG